MRRHEGYVRACESRGKGKFGFLYDDFGDIRESDFRKWFAERGARLFAEKEMPRAKLILRGEIDQFDDGWLIIAVPKARKQRSSVRHVRELLAINNPTPRLDDRKSTAVYQVDGRPNLSSLHMSLMVYDSYHCTGRSLVEVGDEVGLAISREVERKRARKEGLSDREFESMYDKKLRSLVSRHYRMACQYIENLPARRFPVRLSR